jgi:hypothetical protein
MVSRHRGLDEPGRDHVRGHPTGTELTGDRASQPDQPGLAGGVRRLTGVAQVPDDAADEDHPAEPVARHRAGRVPGEAQRGREVRGEDLVRDVVARAQQQRRPLDAGVGDEDLDGPVGVGDQRERLLDRGVVGDVAGDAEQAVDRLAAARGDRDLVSVGGEGTRAGEADAPAATGDEDAAAGHRVDLTAGCS